MYVVIYKKEAGAKWQVVEKVFHVWKAADKFATKLKEFENLHVVRVCDI